MFEDSLKKLSGDEAYEFVAKEVSEDKNEEFQKALDTIGTYSEDMLEELKKSVLTMAEYAASAVPVEKQEKTEADTDNEEVVEKDNAQKEGDVDGNKTETEKSADKKKTEDTIAKSVEEILSSVKEVKENVKKSAEAMKELSSRVEVVEKSTGARKSVKGQDVTKESGETFQSIAHMR